MYMCICDLKASRTNDYSGVMRPEQTIPTYGGTSSTMLANISGSSSSACILRYKKDISGHLIRMQPAWGTFPSSACTDQTWTFGFFLDLRLKVEVEATLYTCNYLDDLFPPVRGSADILMPSQWVSCQFSITENAYCTGDIVVLTALQTRVDHESCHGRFVQTDLCGACIPHVL